MKCNCDRKFEASIKYSVVCPALCRSCKNRVSNTPSLRARNRACFIRFVVEISFAIDVRRALIRISFTYLTSFFLCEVYKARFIERRCTKLVFSTFQWCIKARRWKIDRFPSGYLKLCKFQG